MSDTTAVAKVAGHLTAIVDMADRLLAQAVNDADNPDIPGGNAMVALAPVANLADWQAALDAAEQRHYDDPERNPWPSVAHEDDSAEPWHATVLQTLWFWSDDLRETHGQPLAGRRATIATEARVIRYYLDYLWTTLPEWTDFAEDIALAKTMLENMLREGERDEKTRVPCTREPCARKPMLIKVRMDQAADDFYKCTCCHAHYTAEDFRNAYAKQLRNEQSEKFVPQRDAIATLVAQGRQSRTIRRWLGSPLRHYADQCTKCKIKWAPGVYADCPRCVAPFKQLWRGNADDVIEGFCEVDTHKVWVWWPTLWSKHQAKRAGKHA